MSLRSGGFTSIRHDAERLCETLFLSGIFAASVELAVKRNLPDWWLCGGIIRETLWSSIMDRPSRIPDVDLIYYNEDKSEEAWDKIYEASFSKEGLGARWSIKNQARMWQESRDPRYLRSADALLYAPDTVSSVGIRKRQDGTIVVFAPYGLSDLFSIRLSPTQLFLKHHGMSEFNGRIERKQWQAYWPKMTISATPIECRYNNPIELSPNMRLDLRSSSR